MRRALLLLALALAFAAPGDAGAKEGVLTPVPCPAGCVTEPLAGQAVRSAVGSPDGRFLYVVHPQMIRTIATDAATGAFAAGAVRGCLGAGAGCTALGSAGATINRLVLSADGSRAYAATTDGLWILDRHPVTGELTPVGCLDPGDAPCSSTTDWPSTVAITADGVVVTIIHTSPPIDWLIETRVPTPGGLAVADCLDGAIIATGCQHLPVPTFPLDLATVADTLYVGGSIHDCPLQPCGIVHTAAVAADGGVALLPGASGCMASATGCDPDPALIGTVFSLGGNGTAVLLSSNAESHLIARAGDGSLGAELSCANVTPCGSVPGFAASTLAAGPRLWYGASGSLVSLVLTPAGAVRGDCVGSAPCRLLVGGAGAVVQSPSGGTVYAVGEPVVQRVLADRPPTCTPAPFAAWQATTATLDLHCSDPNGEALTAGIVTQPAGAGAAVAGLRLTYRAPATTGARAVVVDVSDGSNTVRLRQPIAVRKTPDLSLSIVGARAGRGRSGRVLYSVPFNAVQRMRVGLRSGTSPVVGELVRIDFPRGGRLLGEVQASGRAEIKAGLNRPGTMRVSVPSIPSVRRLIVEIALIPRIHVNRTSQGTIRGLVRAGLLPVAGRVELQRLVGSRWRTIGRTTLKQRGFTFSPASGRLRVRFVPRVGLGLAVATRTFR